MEKERNIYFLVKRNNGDVAVATLSYLMKKVTRMKYKMHPEKEMVAIYNCPFLSRNAARNSLENLEKIQFSPITPEMISIIKSNLTTR